MEASRKAEELTAMMIGEISLLAAAKSHRPNTVPTIEGDRFAIPPTHAMMPEALIHTKGTPRGCSSPIAKNTVMAAA